MDCVWYTATRELQHYGELCMNKWTEPGELTGKSSRSRTRLSKLLREGGELLTVERAAEILEMDQVTAAKTLGRWRNQGWLARVKRGVYVAVPVEAELADQALEDAWILIPELFDPAYVGGWSAAEYWDFTEQIFRDICVFTARPVLRRNQRVHNIPFVVTHTLAEHHFGTKVVWKRNARILVSDPTKTIVDMLSMPWTGGGIVHVTECLRQYLRSQHFNERLLIEYTKRLNNGAVFKRLGYLTSQLMGDEHPVVIACQANLTAGKAQLDPALKGDRLITRWRLFVPSKVQMSSQE